MDNTLKPVSYIEQIKGSNISINIRSLPMKISYLPFLHMDHATKECEIANFHGQVSDAYAYV
jgi:hypothetical protein